VGVALEEYGVAVQHIDEHDCIRTQSEILGRLTSRQAPLFVEGMASRKRYKTKL
jgi:hypothetical protein